ncbi:hypothetical protein CK203_052293 [Vitis vinifera]|uniref:Uncharacterized protein n=1 Tax=Vitis vinifera TaxID=29760 RepID=A0A438FWJ1_VITVI|nr:hypothetical protein CK203_052293 [Vitis vinifera]
MQQSMAMKSDNEDRGIQGVKRATIGSGANSSTADNNLAVVELMKK